LVAAWHRDADWLLAAGLCGVVWLVFAFLHAFEATRARCALCSGSLFGVSGNSKSRRARRLLGSYPLHTAVQILASSIYRCQHCGEEIACRPEGPPEPVHGVVGRFGGGMEGGCIPLSRRGLEQGRGGVIRARGLTGEGS